MEPISFQQGWILRYIRNTENNNPSIFVRRPRGRLQQVNSKTLLIVYQLLRAHEPSRRLIKPWTIDLYRRKEYFACPASMTPSPVMCCIVCLIIYALRRDLTRTLQTNVTLWMNNDASLSRRCPSITISLWRPWPQTAAGDRSRRFAPSRTKLFV